MDEIESTINDKVNVPCDISSSEDNENINSITKDKKDNHFKPKHEKKDDN